MIITTASRCGTHWLVGTLRLMAGNMDRRPIRQPFVNLASRIKAFGTRVIYGHIPLALLAPFAEQHKIVVVVRDRRDVLISYAFRHSRGNPGRFAGFRDMLWESGGALFQANWWNSYTEDRQRVPHLLIQYEDMLVRPKEQMMAAWDYLGLSEVSGEPRPDDGLISATLERLKDGVSPSHHKRRGIIGEWREHFSGDEGAAFYDKYMVATAHLGYSRR